MFLSYSFDEDWKFTIVIFQLADQRRRLAGVDDSTYNVRDFLDDSASEVRERSYLSMVLTVIYVSLT